MFSLRLAYVTSVLLLVLAHESQAATFQITTKNMIFDVDGNDLTQVDTLNIHTGDEVDWVWVSGQHTVTSGESSSDPQVGALFDASLDFTHTGFTHIFNDVGIFPYFCRFHEFHDMKGIIVVTAPTDPNDTDGDGITNQDELDNGLDPNDPTDAAKDQDGDGLTALQEVNTHHTDPHNPDSDGDGFWDGFEVAHSSDPKSAASVPVSTGITGDVDYSGATDAVDVQLVINGALNIATPAPTDLNSDSVTNAVDVQVVINAALGKKSKR